MQTSMILAMHPKLKEFNNDHNKFRKWLIDQLKEYYRQHGHHKHFATKQQKQNCPVCNPDLNKD